MEVDDNQAARRHAKAFPAGSGPYYTPARPDLGPGRAIPGAFRGAMTAIPQQREIIDRRELSARLDALA